MIAAIVLARLLVILLALGGIIANLAISSDVKHNLRAARILGADPDLELTARIDIRGARSSAGAHAMFLALGVLALGSTIPDVGPVHVFGIQVPRRILVLIFAIIWDFIQAIVVIAQVKNQIDRVRFRSIN